MIVKKSSKSIELAQAESQEIRERNREVQRRKRVDPYVWKRNRNGTAILVERGVDARDLPDDYECFDRNELVYRTIAEGIAEGSNFTAIARMPGMPNRVTMYRWMDSDEKFRNMIAAAKKHRAEHYHDELQNVAKTVKETNSKSAKVKIDAYKHLMEVGDRDQFGSSTKVTGDPNAPISFIVDTGIKKLESNPAIPAEGRVLDEPGKGSNNHDGIQSEAAPARDTPEPQEV